MDELRDWLDGLLGLGLESHDISAVQMGLRAVVVYVVTLLIVRAAKKRFMGRATAFDVILGIMLGSIVSRAVTGNAPLVPALGAAAVLVAMHWLFSALAVHWHGFGRIIKGRGLVLVRDGQIDHEVLRKAHMTDRDLWEDLRDRSIFDLKEVAEACLERSGKVSVIKAKPEPRIVEIRIAEGIQTVRLEIAA